jgi:RNA polymerase sigma-70 factor, ECF subfamily
MLGSPAEADDAVQESWLHVSRAGTGGVENLAGWLTTVVARVCLDMLRSRRSRREVPVDEALATVDSADPEHEAVMADSLGLALLVVLETLTPAERLAFVLHDLFAVPFEEIAPIVGRTPAAARQLASRARRRVQDADPVAKPDPSRQRAVVSAFLAASRGGDFERLVALLDPDVVLTPDALALRIGAAEARGAAAVAETFRGRAKAAQPATVDGRPGAAWFDEGKVRVAFAFTIVDGRVAAIDLVMDPARIAELDVVPLAG